MTGHRSLVQRAIGLFLILFLGFSIAIGAADDATGSLLSDVPTAVKLLGEGAYNLEVPLVNLTEYGNWYGPGYWGGGREAGAPGSKPPVDALDAVAMRHDFAYQIAEEQGKIHGAAEEQRLKAIADAIAVLEAKKLPADPNDWDPPAPDPQKADRYRRRIGFGFTYLSGGRAASSLALGTYEAIKKALGSGDEPGSQKISISDLQKMVGDRTKNWSDTTQIRSTYRVELKAPLSVIAEGESVPLTITFVSVRAGDTAGEITEAPFNLHFDVDGPGSLSTYEVGASTKTVTLTAKDPWFGTYSGSTINVETWAEFYADPDLGFDVFPSSVDITVATKTTMTLTASPTSIDSWPSDSTDPCQEIVLTATYKTQSGKPIESALIHFTGEDGTDNEVPTNAQGIARHTVTLCESSLDGAESKTFSYKASAPQTTTSDAAVFFPAAASTSIAAKALGTITVRGRVIDSGHNDRPISGATVTLNLKEETKTATTGADGSFQATFRTPPIDELPATVSGGVQMKGYTPKDFSADERSIVIVRMEPLPATITVKVYGTGEFSTELVPGAIIRTSAPTAQMVQAPTGQATVTGFYVGDRLTISAGATNHKTYQKTGTIDIAEPTIVFHLPTGEGDVAGGGLDTTPTEGDDKQDEGSEDGSKTYVLTIWASPADPGVGQHVTVTALVSPREAGVPIRLSVVGTDGYSNSVSTVTDASGRASLGIPGASSGVVDRVTVELLDQGRIRRLNYVF